MIRPSTVAPGVVAFAARTPTLLPATHTNSYALGEREILLVEPATPYEDERREWLEWARGLAASGRELLGLFLTHHHGDHVGGAAFFGAELGLPLWAHRLTADRLPGLRIDRLLDEGEDIVLDGPAAQRWRVLHTPGHAPGHLCLFEPERRQVIVGDMVASVGTILIEPGDGDMTEYLAQLERLAELGDSTALPAHGGPIPNASGHFRYYIRHRLLRESKVLAALEAAGRSGASPEDLLPSAYSDTPKDVWPLAALSVRAHLEKLIREGRGRTDGSRYFASAERH